MIMDDLHATSSMPARWTPLVERKPESGIYMYISEYSSNWLGWATHHINPFLWEAYGHNDLSWDTMMPAEVRSQWPARVVAMISLPKHNFQFWMTNRLQEASGCYRRPYLYMYMWSMETNSVQDPNLTPPFRYVYYGTWTYPRGVIIHGNYHSMDYPFHWLNILKWNIHNMYVRG